MTFFLPRIFKFKNFKKFFILEMTLRTTRAGTRSIAREEIKRVKKSLEKVRRWEKKWVVLEESGLKVFRWVPKPVSLATFLARDFKVSDLVPKLRNSDCFKSR